MPETNFEKNVQQEMLGFKVKPSEELWAKVEERIRKKKRRKFFFILFFAGLALLGYWQRDFLFSEKEPAVTESVTLLQKKISIVDSIKTIIPEKINKEELVKENTEKSKKVLTKNKKTIDPVKEKIISGKKEKQIDKVSDEVVAKTNRDSEKPVSFQIKSIIDEPKEIQILKDISAVEIDAATRIKDRIEISMVKTDTSTPKEIEKISDFKIQVENKVQIDSIQKPESIDSIQKPESKADTMAATKKQPAVSKKWKWGVQVTPGISSSSNKSFSLFKSLNASPDAFSGGPTPPSVPLAKPSNREAGFAIKLGVFAQRKISSGLELSLGLQYSYYSDHILVGGRRDSVLNISPQRMIFSDATQVYAAANSFSNYTNRYHFLELPVTLHIRLNKNSNKPFYFNLGFVTGQMIAGNALVYDTAFRGVYYKSNKLFNKTQFSISPGFLWTIPGKKLQWSFGPDLDIHLNRFLNSSFESEKYLVVPGFKTRVLFQRKK